MANGLRLADYKELTPSEFEAWADQAAQAKSARERGAWERARTVALWAVSPYLTGKAKRNFASLIPLPWDAEEEPEQDAPREARPPMTAEEQRRRMEMIAAKLNLTT